MKPTKLSFTILTVAGLALLSACGDEVTNVTETSGIAKVDNFKSLSECKEDNVGSLAYASDSAKVFTCTESGWVTINGANGKDGVDGKDGEDGNDGENGKNGTKGAKGSNGKDGSSCTVEELASGNGYKVICDGDSIGVLLNGADGKQGTPGKQGDKGDPGTDGEDCYLTDNHDGTVTVTCDTTTTTLYKAMCGTTPYDPATGTCDQTTVQPSTPDAYDCDGTELWCKDESPNYRVQTGLDNDTYTSGYWQTYTDIVDGGESEFEWPTELGNEFDANAFDPVVEYCQGLCGTVHLDLGEAEGIVSPYAGVYFNIVGETSDTDPTPDTADVSEWGGICITYISTVSAKLVMGLDEETTNAVNDDVPVKALPKSIAGTDVCAEWSDFRQSGWGRGEKITGTEAATKLVSLKFEISGTSGTSAEFNIIRLTKYSDAN